MGTVLVVTSAPTLQGPCLLSSSTRNDELRFHYSMHLFVRIIIDAASSHKLDPDTQPPPPQAETGESMRSVTKKWCS